MLKAKLLRLEERLKKERERSHLGKLKKTKLVELILSALKQGETEDDFIEKIEGMGSFC